MLRLNLTKKPELAIAEESKKQGLNTMENANEPYGTMGQKETEEHRQKGRKVQTMVADTLAKTAGKTMDGKTVFKVVAADEQRLVGWLVIPDYLLRSTDAALGILGWEVEKGGLLYTLPSEMKYSDRQERAVVRFDSEHFANATPPRKDDGKRGKAEGKVKWQD